MMDWTNNSSRTEDKFLIFDLFDNIFVSNESTFRSRVMSQYLLENDILSNSGSVKIITTLEDGISINALERVATYLGISMHQLLSFMRISRSTWQRRKKAKKLDFNLSDKTVQLAHLLEHAEQVFGQSEKVRLWFNMPSVVFENRRPVELIGSLSGLNLINEELIRIEQGIYI